jgi:hypothetical protein
MDVLCVRESPGADDSCPHLTMGDFNNARLIFPPRVKERLAAPVPLSQSLPSLLRLLALLNMTLFILSNNWIEMNPSNYVEMNDDYNHPSIAPFRCTLPLEVRQDDLCPFDHSCLPPCGAVASVSSRCELLQHPRDGHVSVSMTSSPLFLCRSEAGRVPCAVS